MKRTIIAMICVIAMSVLNAMTASVCTPKLNPPSVKIPDITIQIVEQLNKAISNTGNKKQYSAKELLELGKQKNHIEIAKQLRIKSN